MSQVQCPNSKAHKKTSICNYSALLSMRNPEKPSMLPGLQVHRSRVKSMCKKMQRAKHVAQQPELLSTGVLYLKRLQGDDVQVKQKEKYNNNNLFSLQREITPIKPSTRRNKLYSTNSQLLNIVESDKQSEKYENQQQMLLQEHILGQSEAVFQHAFGRTKKINPKIIYQWKDCLHHEDKAQIYVSPNAKIPYTHPKIFLINELEKGFQEIYSIGSKNRALMPGEQSLIIREIDRYLEKCNKEPMKISRKTGDIITDILQSCKLTELQSYSFCMKQIQGHFKIMATRWRYSGNLNISDKIMKIAIYMGRSNFVDFRKNNPIVSFLLKHKKNQS